MTFLSSFVKRAASLVDADVAFEDEAKQFFVIVRVYQLIMLIYVMLLAIASCLYGHTGNILLSLPFIVIIVVCFLCTYRFRTRTVFHIFSFTNLIWIYLFLRFFGWDTGIQHNLFPLLVVSFFATYSNFRGKLCYTLFLLAYRLYLFAFVRTAEPLYPLSASLVSCYQVLNMIALFSVLFYVCWCFSQTNQDAQEKLNLYNQRLKEEANRDALTGLLNRRSMLKFLQDRLADTSTDNFLTVAIGDIDHFKRINDTRGHNCGDDVLCQLAGLFKSFMADKGMICRWGGEEFFFAFPSNGDDSYHYIDDLRNKIQNMAFTDSTTKEIFSVTMTFGVEEYDFSASITELIKRADDKLYFGKDQGRNRVVY